MHVTVKCFVLSLNVYVLLKVNDLSRGKLDDSSDERINPDLESNWQQCNEGM